MPTRRRPDPEPTLSIFPDKVHIGDRFTDADTGDEWEVVSRPVTYKKGHEVRARVQRPGDPGTAREKQWAAHERITVRRGMAPAPIRSTAKPDNDDADDVESLRRELRRLRSEVLRLEDDTRAREAHRPLSARDGAAAGEDPAGNLDVVEAGRDAPASRHRARHRRHGPARLRRQGHIVEGADRPLGGPGDPVHIVRTIVPTEAAMISDDPAVAAMGRPRAPCSGLRAPVVDVRE